MTDDSTCPSTAPELYQSSAVFVSLSLAAWGTIVLGYLVPFCFVATLLTWNGYTPSADTNPQETDAPGTFVGGVFPAAYGTSGAPPGCVDRLHTVLLEEFPNDYPHECCVSSFSVHHCIVALFGRCCTLIRLIVESFVRTFFDSIDLHGRLLHGRSYCCNPMSTRFSQTLL